MKSLLSTLIILFFLWCVIAICTHINADEFATRNKLKYIVTEKGTFFDEYFPTDTFFINSGCIYFIDKTCNSEKIISPPFSVKQPLK